MNVQTLSHLSTLYRGIRSNSTAKWLDDYGNNVEGTLLSFTDRNGKYYHGDDLIGEGHVWSMHGHGFERFTPINQILEMMDSMTFCVNLKEGA